MEQTWLWIGFNVFVLVMLAVDLFVFHKDAHEVRVREAAAWSVVWVTLALLFGGGVYAFMGRDAGLEYFAGYLIEKALSVDNIFVFVLIFGFFRVPKSYQHRVLSPASTRFYSPPIWSRRFARRRVSRLGTVTLRQRVRRVPLHVLGRSVLASPQVCQGCPR